MCVRNGLVGDAGKVQLLAKGEPISQQYCHCRPCRQYHCAPFIATVLFKTSDFEITQGEETCHKYNITDDVDRLSCSSCRSPIVNIPNRFNQVRSTFPMLWKDLEFNPKCHIWWSQRMIKDQFDQLPKNDGWGTI